MITILACIQEAVYITLLGFPCQPSFHVGSEGNSTVFKTSIEKSLTIFQEAQHIGYNLSLLDIGGGFPGTSESNNILSILSDSIGQSLKEFLTAFPHTKVVSEPGENYKLS